MGQAPRTPWGERLRAALAADGRTAAWLARMLGMSRQELNHAMAGRRSLSPERKRLAAAYLQRRYEDIFDPEPATTR